MQPRIVGRGTQKQLVIGGTRAHQQHDSVLFRLGDLVDAAAGDAGVDFPGGKAQGEAVHGHGGASFRGDVPVNYSG